ISPRQVDEPIANGVRSIALFEIHENAMRSRSRCNVWDRLSMQRRIDGVDHLGRRKTEVHIEVNPLAVLPRLGAAAAENRDLRLHELAVGNNDSIPIARLDAGLTPANLLDHSLFLIDANPVPHRDRPL